MNLMYKISWLKKIFFSERFLKEIFVIFLIVNFLFNATYQQYIHFDIEDPRGAGDANYYQSMANGEYNIYQLARYRFIIPSLVYLFRKFSLIPIDPGTQDPNQSIFYVITFFITTVTAYCLYRFNLSLKLNFYSSLFGTCIFIFSRPTIINVGTPHIDSLYNLSILVIMLCTVNKKLNYLSIFLPFLILSKITIFPFIFFPLFEKKFRTLKYYFSIVFSLFTLISVRTFIDYKYPCSICSMDKILPINATNHFTYFFWDFYNHAIRFFANIYKLFSLNGVFDFLMASFSMFFIMAILGYINREKISNFYFPNYLLFILPITFYYSIISGNFGRMFFGSFPVIIPLASYFFQFIFFKEKSKKNKFI